METALQEAIKKLQEENRAVFGEYMKDEGTKKNELASESNGLLTAIRICKSLLPKEREQIEQAFRNGQNDVTFDPHDENDNGNLNPYYETSPQEYYETNFNTK